MLLAEAPAQTETSQNKIVPMVHGGGASGGVRAYRPGRWGVVSVDVSNPAPTPATIEVSYHFDPEPEVDYGQEVGRDGVARERERATQGTLAPQYKFTRRLWLPPNSRRQALCPILTPPVDAKGAYNAICTVADVTGGEPKVLVAPGGQLQRNAILSIPIDRLVSAMFSDKDVPTDAQNMGSYEALVASRVVSGLSRRIALFDPHILPASKQSLHAVDHLVIDNLVPFRDSATLIAVQRWLRDGGRMWVMLDAIGVDAAAQLLGNEFHGAEIDRVDLTTVQFTSTRGGAASEPVDYERPIPMTRVAVEGAEVLYEIDGWPAAFVKDFGRGRVIFTTVDPRALVRRSGPGDGHVPSPDFQSNWLPRPELLELASLMYAPLPELPLKPEELRPFLAQQIGYRIVPRTPILLILSGFVGALGVAGSFFWRRGQTIRLAWIAPVIALVATVPIAVLGTSTQKSIPNTVAIGQVLPIAPGTDEINVTGTAAFYHQSPTNLVASSDDGGWLLPEIPTNDQTVHEMVWTDYDQWNWRNFRVPPSVISGAFWRATPYQGEPCRVEATFNEQGLAGRLIGGDWKSLEDAIVVVPSNRGLATEINQDGSFIGAPGRVLARDQYVGANILSDQQRRRQELLRDVFQQAAERQFPSQPTLLFWTDPLELPFQFADDARVTGDALAYAPLDLQRPASGSRVVVPSSFLPLKAVAGPNARGVASSYQASTGEFAEMSSASDTWLRAQLPDVLLPMDVERLEIRLQINAPSRTLTIAAAQNEQLVELEEFRNPSGLITATIDRAELLALDASGGFRFGLLIGQADGEQNQSAKWRIDDLQLTAEGQVP